MQAAKPSSLSGDDLHDAYWAVPAAQLLADLRSGPRGLAADEAERRLGETGPNTISKAGGDGALTILAGQFRSPLVLILIFAAIVSAFVGEGNEAGIIVVIVLASCILSFTQEYSASKSMESLRRSISRRATVLRDGAETTITADSVVPGDVVRLSAGNLIPADGVILEALDFNVSEAALTGETFPVDKSPGVAAPGATLGQRSNVVFTGTSVRSGTATVLVTRTGNRTEFAGIAATLMHRIPETEFSKGIRRFGYLMTQVMLAIVIVVFFVSLLEHRPLIDSLLFSLALAVGLTPELLPAIISVTLGRGARTLAKNGVIVRRLDAIENLGSMDILCTDKTGTLTEGVIHLDAWLDASGATSPEVLRWACLNATLQTGIRNPLDEAIAAHTGKCAELPRYRKLDEFPYDFVRKRLSVVVEDDDEGPLLICKGAVANIIEVSTQLIVEGKATPFDEAQRQRIDAEFQGWSAKGFRVLAVATRALAAGGTYSRHDENGLTLVGFLLFLDPPKAGIKETLKALAARGISVKMITGDNRYVAAHVAEGIGLKTRHIVTGEALSDLTKEALFGLAPKTDIFAEIDPNQKERIIAALRQHGHAVGYLGDGINDAPALHTADVGISVDSAVDVAREAADVILLKRDLGVLLRGIDDGRRTFANTMKYVSITTSANFGNMISMAFASLLLPFLPLLAKQILLNNFLADFPSLSIATDRVDAQDTLKPKHWDIAYVRRFMVSFGLISSLFDFLTFGFLLFIVHANVETFQTAWFIESIVTQLAILFIVRTRHPFWRSRPSPTLALLSLATGIVAITLTYLPIGSSFGFVPLPLPVMLGLAVITLLYLVVTESAKRLLFGHAHRKTAHKGLRRRNLRRYGAE